MFNTSACSLSGIQNLLLCHVLWGIVFMTWGGATSALKCLISSKFQVKAVFRLNSISISIFFFSAFKNVTTFITASLLEWRRAPRVKDVNLKIKYSAYLFSGFCWYFSFFMTSARQSKFPPGFDSSFTNKSTGIILSATLLYAVFTETWRNVVCSNFKLQKRLQLIDTDIPRTCGIVVAVNKSSPICPAFNLEEGRVSLEIVELLWQCRAFERPQIRTFLSCWWCRAPNSQDKSEKSLFSLWMAVLRPANVLLFQWRR